MRRRLVPAITCAALALTLGACGKSDDSSQGRDSGGDGTTIGGSDAGTDVRTLEE